MLQPLTLLVMKLFFENTVKTSDRPKNLLVFQNIAQAVSYNSAADRNSFSHEKPYKIQTISIPPRNA